MHQFSSQMSRPLGTMFTLFLILSLLSFNTLSHPTSRNHELFALRNSNLDTRSPTTPQPGQNLTPANVSDSQRTPAQSPPAPPAQSAVSNSTSASNGDTSDNNNVTAAFIANQRPTGQTSVNCSDLETGLDDKCWKELELSKFVAAWVRNSSCDHGQSFVDCFVSQNRAGQMQCSNVALDACSAPDVRSYLSQPKVFYVLYNIHSINQFFNSWYTAVGSGSSLAASNLDTITRIIDKVDETNINLDHILLGITGMLCFVPGPLTYMMDEVWKTAASAQAVIGIAEVMTLATPQMARFLLPADTGASQNIQIGMLKKQLGDKVKQVTHAIADTANATMFDPTQFLAFAQAGNFSKSVTRLDPVVDHMLYAFNTYIISTALVGNGIRGTVAWDTNPQALVTNGTKTPYKLNCPNYDAQGVCDSWYYDSQNNSAWGLNSYRHLGRNMGSDLSQLLTFTTGGLLLRNAYECGASGVWDQAANVSISASGLYTGCISQLKVFSWNMSCPVTKGASCEFNEGPSQPSFALPPAYHAPQRLAVPPAYLGPGINLNHSAGYSLTRDS